MADEIRKVMDELEKADWKDIEQMAEMTKKMIRLKRTEGRDMIVAFEEIWHPNIFEDIDAEKYLNQRRKIYLMGGLNDTNGDLDVFKQLPEEMRQRYRKGQEQIKQFRQQLEVKANE